MSVSKLESLPNEVLINMFEKYINGVDMVVAFANLQNQRFNGIISQCRRFTFNFHNCRRDLFPWIIRRLPPYLHRIEEFILSEQNTPGHIQAFLSYMPSFMGFKNLRKFYFECNDQTIDGPLTERALMSLSYTLLENITIKATTQGHILKINRILGDLFRLKNIKRINFISDFDGNKWNFGQNISSTVEYFTNFDQSSEFCHLPSIFQAMSKIKYCNIRFLRNPSNSFYRELNPPLTNFIKMSYLETLILSFESDDSTTFNRLAECLQVTPVLRRLEIQAHKLLLEANAWQALIKSSLPLLNEFLLRTTTKCLQEDTIEDILATFNTPFWQTMKGFYFMITKHDSTMSSGFDTNNIQYDPQNQYNQPVAQCWIVPSREHSTNSPTNRITSFSINGSNSSLSDNYYFNNIKHLVIHRLDNDILQWLITHVNFSSVRYLDISSIPHESNGINLLLLFIRNIISLRIQYKLLHKYQKVYLGKDNSIQYVDVSVGEFRATKKNIVKLSTLFPHLDFLVVNTIKLSNVQIIKPTFTRFRHPVSKIIDIQFTFGNKIKKKNFDKTLFAKFRCLFERKTNLITLRIDEDGFEERLFQILQ